MTIRSFNIKRKAEELEYLREIYNDAFSENWHFTPPEGEAGKALERLVDIIQSRPL